MIQCPTASVWSNLIFSEETGDHSSGGGPGQSHLAVDDDRSIEFAPRQRSDEKVVVIVSRRAGVTHRNTVELETCNDL